MFTFYRMIAAVLAPTILVILVALLLCLPPPFKDMLQSAEEQWRVALAFQVSLAMLGFAVWFWSWTALNFALGVRDRDRTAAFARLGASVRPWCEWRPTMLLGAAGVVVAPHARVWDPAASRS